MPHDDLHLFDGKMAAYFSISWFVCASSYRHLVRQGLEFVPRGVRGTRASLSRSPWRRSPEHRPCTNRTADWRQVPLRRCCTRLVGVGSSRASEMYQAALGLTFACWCVRRIPSHLTLMRGEWPSLVRRGSGSWRGYCCTAAATSAKHLSPAPAVA